MQFLFVQCILSHYWVKYKIEYLPAESATDFFILWFIQVTIHMIHTFPGHITEYFYIKDKMFIKSFFVLCAKSLQSCSTLCDPMDCSPPESSVHGILQARILEWVVISSSRGSSWPRDWTLVSCLLFWQAGSSPLPPSLMSFKLHRWENSTVDIRSYSHKSLWA